MVQNAQPGFGDHLAHDDRVQTPLFEDPDDLGFAILVGHQQHALLALAQHDLVGGHARFALRHVVQLDFEPHAAAGAHLAGRAGEPGGAHILDAHHRAGAHGLDAGLEQQLLHEWVAHLHVGPLLLRALLELFAGHGGSVDAVAARLRAHVNHRIADAGCLGIKDLVPPHQAQGKGVDQGIARIARLKARLPTQVGDAEAIAVAGDAADHPFQQGMVLVDHGGGRRRRCPAPLRRWARNAASP